MTNKSCCFTGHRRIYSGEEEILSKLLRQEIIKLIKSGVRTFICGGAIGFDSMAAQEVLYLKQEGYNIELHLTLPCKNQDKYWKEEQKDFYLYMIMQANKVEYVCEKYTPTCMKERNKRMVDNAQYCICYLHDDRSATAMTVRYANKCGRTIINLADEIE